MNFTKIVIKITDKLKPVLVKVIPIQILRKIKQKFLGHQLGQMKIQPKKGFIPNKFADGINLVANIKGDSGLGQSSRLIANILERSQLPFSIKQFTSSKSLSMSDTTYDRRLKNDLPYNINLLHVNPHEFAIAYTELDKKTWNYRYNIAFWLWELEEFPDEWTTFLPLLDEIWTPAEFVSKSIRKKTNIPVRTMPYCISVPTDDIYNRTYFKIPENQFLFLMMYDSSSIMERKNPLAVMEAFKKAFSPEDKNVGIVIKINNVQKADLDCISEALGEYSNVYLIKNTMSKIEVNSLIKCVNVVVSLHRAEGFGLVLAEAMKLGIPTIATNWSANTEFMNKDVACMVDYDLITLDHDVGPYAKGNHWADAHVEEAAVFMRKLADDCVFYQKISEKAKAYIDDRLSINRAVKRLEHRISEIYEMKGVQRHGND